MHSYSSYSLQKTYLFTLGGLHSSVKTDKKYVSHFTHLITSTTILPLDDHQ